MHNKFQGSQSCIERPSLKTNEKGSIMEGCGQWASVLSQLSLMYRSPFLSTLLHLHPAASARCLLGMVLVQAHTVIWNLNGSCLKMTL